MELIRRSIGRLVSARNVIKHNSNLKHELAWNVMFECRSLVRFLSWRPVALTEVSFPSHHQTPFAIFPILLGKHCEVN
jgi:hypothetical protein